MDAVGRQDPGVLSSGPHRAAIDGSSLHADALIIALEAEYRAAAVPSLADASGWIPAARHALARRFKKIHAIDAAGAIPLAMGRPLPKSGALAHAQTEVVAHNVAVKWAERGAQQKFDGVGACFIETGDDRAAMGQGDFYAEPRPR
jgi:sulfide:quinone oxidoreductase